MRAPRPMRGKICRLARVTKKPPFMKKVKLLFHYLLKNMPLE